MTTTKQLAMDYAAPTSAHEVENVRTRGDLICGVLNDVFEHETGGPLTLDAVAKLGDGELGHILNLAAQWLALEVEILEDDELLAADSMFRWLALEGAFAVVANKADEAMGRPGDCPNVVIHNSLGEAGKHREQGGCTHCTDKEDK